MNKDEIEKNIKQTYETIIKCIDNLKTNEKTAIDNATLMMVIKEFSEALLFLLNKGGNCED